jgi:hypothetical protein
MNTTDNTQHTPYPWLVKRIEGENWIEDASGTLIAKLPGNDTENARLIASAPALLKERDGLFKQNQEFRLRLSDELGISFELKKENEELKGKLEVAGNSLLELYGVANKEANELKALNDELLEALKTIQSVLTGWNSEGKYINLIEFAKTAIAKAEGAN